MKQPRLSIDITRAFKCADRIESVLKVYFRVWANQDTKGMFIRPERVMAFDRVVKWSIDCRNMNSEISYAFKRLGEQLARGVTDTKKQGEVKWFTMPDVIMQYYCNDIAYRIRSEWDRLGQIINVYFLNSELDKRKVTFHTVRNFFFKRTHYKEPASFLEKIESSEIYKNLKSYRDDFTHNITQELANMYKLHGKFWHTDELIHLLIDGYVQLVEAFEIIFKAIGEDSASTDVTDFQEMLDRTPFFKG